MGGMFSLFCSSKNKATASDDGKDKDADASFLAPLLAVAAGLGGRRRWKGAGDGHESAVPVVGGVLVVAVFFVTGVLVNSRDGDGGRKVGATACKHERQM